MSASFSLACRRVGALLCFECPTPARRDPTHSQCNARCCKISLLVISVFLWGPTITPWTPKVKALGRACFRVRFKKCHIHYFVQTKQFRVIVLSAIALTARAGHEVGNTKSRRIDNDSCGERQRVWIGKMHFGSSDGDPSAGWAGVRSIL